jgi:hypothetical protein
LDTNPDQALLSGPEEFGIVVDVAEVVVVE